MTRNVDYQTRKTAVLSAAINRYIKDAQPVSSELLARDFGLSPATIRNIFAELEEEGFLTHPYTSGGRIPTNQGYRYYVDFMLSEMGILRNEKERIEREFHQQVKKIEDALEKASEVIFHITHYAGIVSFLEWQDKLFCRGMSSVLEQPEFQDLGRIRLLVGLLEEKRRLLDIVNRDFRERVKVYIGEEMACPEMRGCSLVVAAYRRKSRPSGRIAVLGPARMEYRHIIPSLEYISDALSEVLDTI
jgi:heat-inducible transcriptional repressor